MDDPIGRLVAALRVITAEHTDSAAIIGQAKPLAVMLAQETSWVRRAFYEVDEKQGMGINVLNQEDDDTIFVEVISWMPGFGVAPHDHQTWGVVVGIDGVEINVNWRRIDDGSKIGFADLEKVRETIVRKGNVVTFLPNDIHSVRNDGDKPSLSLHIYGRVLAKIERSEFDPINKIQRPCPQRVRRSVDKNRIIPHAEA